MPVDLIPPGVPEDVVGLLQERFAEQHGRPAAGCFVAPGRVNLIGEHLDYNGGRCLPFALPHGTYTAVAPREDDVVTVASLQVEEPWQGRIGALGPGQVSGWVAYVAGVLWALREDGIAVPGVDLLVDGRVPLGAGLSSSAALECSVALAACLAAGVEVDDAVRHRVVAACRRAENEVAGAATGGLDQSVAMLAQPGHALLLDFANGGSRQVPWDPAADGLTLLVVDTRVHHALNDGGYAARRADCEAAAAALDVDLLATVTSPEAALERLVDDRARRRARHVFSEQARVDAAVAALDRGDLTALGALFNESHASLRDDFEVSCPELDLVVETAVGHGALGARMTGGGFGGSAIVLAPADRATAVEDAVAAAFEERGWTTPGMLLADPAPGARRLA